MEETKIIKTNFDNYRYYYKNNFLGEEARKYNYALIKENNNCCCVLDFANTLDTMELDFWYFTQGYEKNNKNNEFHPDQFNDPKELKIVDFTKTKITY